MSTHAHMSDEATEINKMLALRAKLDPDAPTTVVMGSIKHIYSVSTAKRANYPYRKYGYVINIDPPIEHTTTGKDIEGIGWVPHRGGPRKHLQRFQGWYKYKTAAVERAKQLNIK